MSRQPYVSHPPPALGAVTCPRCSAVLGHTDGPRLYLAATYFRQRAVLHCRTTDCGGYRVWYPAPPAGSGPRQQ